jgi:hypothetical protein
MPAATVFVDSNATGSCPNGCLPQVNGGETFELWDTSAKLDGATIAMAANGAYQRKNPGDPAGVAGSWTVVPEASANPGQGAGASSNAGVRINEMADASDYTKEFVELYLDDTPAPPDAIPPSAILDLAAAPLGATSIRLSWTAPGDDGATGTAAAYDVRYANAPIVGRPAFDAATPLPGEPAPAVAGTPQTFDAAGLVANRTYWFAALATDEAGNDGAAGNTAGATTAPAGGGGGAGHLVVSEIQTNGDGGTPADDELVEIHNPTASAVSLSGKSLQYKSATGTTFLVQTLSGTVAPGGYYLVARAAYNGSPAADLVTSTIQMSASGGHVLLVNGTSALASSTSASIIDNVAWGTGNCPEGTAAPAPPANGSVERKPGAADPLCGNGTDSDANAADFATRAASQPQSTASAPEACGGGPGNVGLTLRHAAATGLTWSPAFGATGYKVRRSAQPDFMVTHPIPDDTHLLASPAAPQHMDPASPPAGSCWYYFVNATQGAAESPEDTLPW